MMKMGKVQLKLDRYLVSIGVTRYKLAVDTEIGYQTIDNYYKNKIIRYDSYILSKICEALHCDIGDIIEYVEE